MPDSALVRALLESAAGEWVLILSLVFGGCCSNVYALEALLKHHSNAGTFLTFAQFLYVAVQTLSSQVIFPSRAGKSWFPGLPRLRKRAVPMRRWMVQVVLFFGVSLMNNYVFGLKIPVTVHIIFRSGGLCVSMLTGYLLAGRRYSLGQVSAGILITVGIIVATISAPRRPSSRGKISTSAVQSSSSEYLPEHIQYVVGIVLLSAALVVSAALGLWQEQTYRVYGKQWREALFYCHFLSLPFFIPLYPTLSGTFNSFLVSPPLALVALPAPTFSTFFAFGDDVSSRGGKSVHWRQLAVPGALVALLVNVVTQGLCVTGVNRLTSRVNSTTVNLVLTLRKAVSLAISVWFYGSGFSTGLALGGCMVLVGTVVYSLAPGPVALIEKEGSASKARPLPDDAAPHTYVGASKGSTTAIDRGGTMASPRRVRA